ncbi:MAG: hypothetical protein MK098_11775 [Marinovum sp.]|nr:hypothetical protein [Marinovum sp.]
MTDAQFQKFLDGISECFITNAFETWKSHVILPFSLITQNGLVDIQTEDHLHRNFDKYVVAMEMMGIDKIYRAALSLQDCQDGTWIGTYQTHLLAQGVLATEPYTASALLTIVDDTVKAHSILNARSYHEWTRKHPGED